MRPPRPADDENASPSRFGAGLTRHQRRRQEWRLRDEHSEELLDDCGLRLADWLANGAATVVKQGAHRAVYRLALPSGNYYLKQYRLAGPRAWLQNNLRPCRSYREAAGITRLSTVGIQTAELVAVGRETHGPFSGESFVLTRELPHTRPLDEFLRNAAEASLLEERGDQASLRRRVIEQLASLTASLHRHGLFHADFHAGNVLVQSDGDGARLFLIDLLPLRTEAMTPQRRWSMLGMLATSLSPHASRADRRRFLDAYSKSLGVHDDPRTVEAFCAAEVVRRQSRADRKWRRGNRHVAILDADGIACRGLAEIGRETLVAWRNSIARGEAASLPKTATLRRLPAGNAAREAWENGHALLRRGMPVARPLMFLEKRNGGIIVRDGAMPCATFPEWLRHASDGVCREDHVETLAAVGRLLRRLDDAGFTAPPDAIAVSTGGGVIVDRPEQVVRRTIWRPRREGSPQRMLSTISNIADRTTVETAYRGTTARPAESTTEPQSVVRRRVPFQRAAAAVLLAITTLFAGCRSIEKPTTVAALPAKHSVRASQLVLISDFKLAKDDPLVDDLIDLREQVVSTLQLPEPRQDVVVYMFSNEDAYRRYLEMVHPGLPSRRAYFVGTKKSLPSTRTGAIAFRRICGTSTRTASCIRASPRCRCGSTKVSPNTSRWPVRGPAA